MFYHRQRNIRFFVHGDDFVSSGRLTDIEWLKGVLENKYNLKTEIIGESEKLGKSLRILNRLVEWIPGRGLRYEPDPRLAKKIIRDTGVENMTTLKTPMEREDKIEDEADKNRDIERRKRWVQSR